MKSKDSAPKFKERSEEAPGYRALLLWMVRLIHADPMLMLNVSEHSFLKNKRNYTYLFSMIYGNPEFVTS